MQIRPPLSDNVAPAAPEQTRARERAQPAGSFRSALAGLNGDMQMVKVQRGDTLVGMTRRQLGTAASQFSNAQILDMARTVARENGIDNANRISAGQSINMAPMSTLAALKLRQPAVAAVQLDAGAASAPTPVLDRTLARAVSKGYVSPAEQAAVREKILSLSSRHQFTPDDFAQMTLMESDGMNPRATNGSCHGIIQFCAGGNRGAASAGYAKNPKEILKLSVLDQLDLVDRYFNDTRLKDYGPASLDNLYLTVLTPAARGETRSNVPLPIGGRQAAQLYEGRDQNGVITRNSLIAGLRHNARERLSDFSSTLARADVAGM